MTMLNNPRLLKLIEDYQLPDHFVRLINDDSQRKSQTARIEKPFRSVKANKNQLSNTEQLSQKQA